MGRRRRKNRTHLKGPAKGETEVSTSSSILCEPGTESDVCRRKCQSRSSSRSVQYHSDHQQTRWHGTNAGVQSGDVTTSITQLVKDMRQLMEPNTASRLRVSQVIYCDSTYEADEWTVGKTSCASS